MPVVTADSVDDTIVSVDVIGDSVVVAAVSVEVSANSVDDTPT